MLKTIWLEMPLQTAFDPTRETATFTLSFSDPGEMEFLRRLLERLAQEAPNANLKSVVKRRADLAIGYFPDLTSSVFAEWRVSQITLNRRFGVVHVAQHCRSETALTRRP